MPLPRRRPSPVRAPDVTPAGPRLPAAPHRRDAGGPRGSEASVLVHQTGHTALATALSGAGGPEGTVAAAEWALEQAGLATSETATNSARLARVAALSADGPADRTHVAEAALALIETSHGHRLPADVVRRLSRVLDCGGTTSRRTQLLSGATVHTDAPAGRAARQLGARAFALGPDVYFAPGTYRPGTPGGDELLAHELVHVVQHAEGRLPRGPAGGVSVSRPSDAHEREATTHAARARARLHDADDPVLEAIVADIASSLGVAPPPVHGGTVGRQRARAAGARGVMEAGRVYVDTSAVDPETRDGRTLVAHELIHVAQAHRPADATPTAGPLAELEAHTLAPDVARGRAVSVRCGLPLDHVAAETPPPRGTVDLDPDLVLERAVADMEAALAELTGSFAYMELEASVTGAASTEREPRPASTPDEEATASAPSEATEPAHIDTEAALAGVREEAAYPDLLGHGAMADHGLDHPIVAELRALFSDLFTVAARCGLDATTLELLHTTVLADAAASPPHAAMVTIDTLISAWPVDPVALVPELALLSERPPPSEAPAEATPESPRPDLEPSGPPPPASPPPLSNPVTDQPDPGSALRALDGQAAASGTLDGSLDAAAAFSDAAGDGAGLHLDRLPMIGATLAEGALAGLVPGVADQLLDTVVLERIGILADTRLLPALLQNIGLRGAPKLSMAGPALGLVGRGVTAIQEGDVSGLVAAERDAFYDGVEDLGEAHAAVAAAMDAEGLERAPHLVRAAAEAYEVLGDIATFVGSAAGLLSALLLAGVAIAGLTTGGAALVACAPVVQLATSLATLSTLCVPVTMWTWSVASVLHGVAATLVDDASLASSLDAVGDQARSAAGQVGAFAADKVGGAAADAMYPKVAEGLEMARRQVDPEARAPEAVDGTAVADTMAQAQAQATQRAEATLEQAAEVVGRSPAPRSGTATDALPSTRALTDQTLETATRVEVAADHTQRVVRRLDTDVEGRVTALHRTARPSPEAVGAAAAAVDGLRLELAEAHRELQATAAAERVLQDRTRAALRALRAADGPADALYPQLDQLAAAQQRLRAARQALTTREHALADARERLGALCDATDRWRAEHGLDDAEPGPDMGTSGSGSASATGGLGSTVKALYLAIRDADETARGALAAARERGRSLDSLLAQLDTVEAPSPGPASDPASDSSAAAAEFLSTPAPEGGAELLDDLHGALALRDRARRIASRPQTAPDTLPAPIDDAMAGQRAFYLSSAHAFLLGGVEAAIDDLAAHHPAAAPAPASVLALDAVVDDRADRAAATREARAALGATVGEQPTLPAGAVQVLSEGQAMARALGEAVDGPDPGTTTPPTDLDTVLEDARSESADTVITLDHQADTLDAQGSEAAELRDAIATEHARVEADHAAVEGRAEAVRAHRIEVEAEARAAADGVGGPAQAAAAGLTDLRAWQADVDAALATPGGRSGP